MFSRSLLAAVAALTFGASVVQAAESQVLFPQCPAEGACGEAATIDVKSELGWALSEGAEIIVAEDATYAAETVRWSKYSAPTFQAVVQVTNEKDVQAVVSKPHGNRSETYINLDRFDGQTSATSLSSHTAADTASTVDWPVYKMASRSRLPR